MLFDDNNNILKKKYPKTWNQIELTKENMDHDLINQEESKRRDKTLLVNRDDGKKLYIHSKYNPLREAESIIEEYKELKDNSTVVFYGVGLGYHIDLFIKRYPNVPCYIYEPIPELLYHYLS